MRIQPSLISDKEFATPIKVSIEGAGDGISKDEGRRRGGETNIGGGSSIDEGHSA